MKRHPFDLVSFVPGALFAVIAAAALAGGADLDGWGLQWLFPLGLIGVGVAVLLGSIGRGPRPLDGSLAGEPPPADDAKSQPGHTDPGTRPPFEDDTTDDDLE